MDAFFASVEQRDNPELRGQPIVVGGRPEHRGVVAAASYEAREYGIRSAMPSRTAVQRCPHVVFVHPRFDVYREVSNEIREIFHSYTDLVEPLSLDEAYLDVTHNKRGLPSATLIAREIKERIRERTGLTASAGVSINKFLAKTASDVRKPNGLFLIRPQEAEAFVAELPIEKFYGIGKVTAEKMHRLGVRTGADLRRFSEADLAKIFGKAGSFYYNIVRGRDERPVEPNRIRRSVGAEESYAEDLVTMPAILSALDEIAACLHRRISECQAFGRTLTLKVKYADYQQVTRSRTSAAAFVELEQIIIVARDLLASTEAQSRRVRLLGLTLSNLEADEKDDDCVQLTLRFD